MNRFGEEAELYLNKSIKKIRFKNLQLEENAELGFEELDASDVDGGFQVFQAFAIDPTQLVFDNATAVVEAKGTQLFKCRQWNFVERVCEGTWEKIKDIIPGQEYEIELSAQDPAYAESGITAAMIAYYTSTNPTLPKYRLGTAAGWGGEQNARNLHTGDDTEWIVLKSNHVRDEYVMATLDDVGHIHAQVYNASGWGALINLTGSIGTTNDAYRGFGVAVEDLSGRVMVVFSNGSTIPQYNIWNGSFWNRTNGSLLSDGCTGVIRWVKLASKPGSNEILEVDLDANGDFCAQVWDGTKWGNARTLDTAPAAVAEDRFCVAYSQNNGNGIAVWESSTAGRLNYANWTAGAWSASTYTGTDFGSANLQVECASMPGSNRIMIATEENTAPDSLNLREWNGNGWGTWKDFGAIVEDDVASARMISVEYLGDSGNALVVYATDNANSFSYANCTDSNCFSGIWNAPTPVDTTNCAAEQLKTLRLIMDPNTNDVFMSFMTQTSNNKCTADWNASASSWTSVSTNLGSGSVLALSEPLMIAFKKFDYSPYWNTSDGFLGVNDSTPLPNNTAVKFYSYWYDDLRLSNYSLEWNQSGSFANNTWLDFDPNNNTWGNYTVVVAGSDEGKFISGRIWANDSRNQFNATTLINISVQSIPPTLNVTNYVNATLNKSGEVIPLNIFVSDIGIGVDAGYGCPVTIGGASAGTISFSGDWCNGTITVPNGLSDGNNSINVSARDTNLNLGYNDSFVVKIDNTPPTVFLSSPENQSDWSNDSLAFKFIPQDGGFRNATLYANFSGSWTANESNSSPVANNSINTITANIGGLADGAYKWSILACDSVGNCGFNSTTNYSIFVDRHAPIVLFDSPFNQSIWNNDSLAFKYIPQDKSFKNATLYANFTGSWEANESNSTPIANNSINSITVNIGNLVDGTYLWNILACDGAGGASNCSFNATTNYTLVVHRTPPVVLLSTPANRSVWSNDSLNFKYVPQDLGFKNATVYTNFTGSWAANESNSSAITNNSENTITVLLGNLADGVYQWNVLVCDVTDSGNNCGFNSTTNYTIVSDRTPPKWFNGSANASQVSAGDVVKHMVNWADNVSGLGWSLFEWNATDTGCDTDFQNVSNTSFAESTFTEWHNATMVVPTSCEGKIIGFKWYANDSVENWNATTVNAYPVLNASPLLNSTFLNAAETERDSVVCVNASAGDAGIGVSLVWAMITYPNGTSANVSLSDVGCNAGGANDNRWGAVVLVGSTPGNLTVNTTYANDSIGNLGFEIPFPQLNVTVSNPPYYNTSEGFLGTNITEPKAKVGDVVKFYSYWYDDLSLTYYTLEWNASGTMQNESWLSFPESNNSWGNYSIKIPSSASGKWVQWRIWANGSSNVTETQFFETESALLVNSTAVNASFVPAGRFACINASAGSPNGLESVWAMVTYSNGTQVNVTMSDTGCNAGEAGDNKWGTEFNVTYVTGNLTVNTTYAQDNLGNLGFEEPFPQLNVSVGNPIGGSPIYVGFYGLSEGSVKNSSAKRVYENRIRAGAVYFVQAGISPDWSKLRAPSSSDYSAMDEELALSVGEDRLENNYDDGTATVCKVDSVNYMNSSDWNWRMAAIYSDGDSSDTFTEGDIIIFCTDVNFNATNFLGEQSDYEIAFPKSFGDNVDIWFDSE